MKRLADEDPPAAEQSHSSWLADTETTTCHSFQLVPAEYNYIVLDPNTRQSRTDPARALYPIISANGISTTLAGWLS